MKFNLINHHFKLEFVDSGLYFVQDENSFIHPLLQVGSGSGGPDFERILFEKPAPESESG